ncbi:hypothetical protein I6N95_18690 [Vagococcus sp. BWB3-3]|uniref:Uncharacterized protein n=1 Tax=Vagococcus allomyrinae TaxID=2794353 RepID=A0A940STE7_9ENTE|nr:hypothetical protein [Vagococcus allomyrinae]MBP1043047.1 hypothetical protein [Vagococcus allomyrinae]
MIRKSCKVWWLFSIFSFVFAYSNPYLGALAFPNMIACFFDFVLYVLLKGHYNILQKKIKEGNHVNKLKKAFNVEIMGFIGMKVFILVCIIFGTVVLIVNNVEPKKILAPFYFNFIAENVVLQTFCTVFSLICAISSCVLFIVYARLHKQ